MSAILLVDDEQAILDSLARDLRQFSREHNLEVLMAESGEKALAILDSRRGEIAVILSDDRMPGLRGTTFCQIAAERYPTIPAILLTGNASVAEISRYLRSGLSSFLTKPWDRDVLQEAVHDAVLKNRLQIAEDQRDRMLERELDQARSLQAGFQTLKRQRLGDCYLSFETHSPENVPFAGDLVYSVDLDENRHLLLFGDVSGHGIAASYTCSLVHSLLEREFRPNTEVTPASCLTWLNRRFNEIIPINQGVFIAMAGILIDLEANRLIISNGGQPPVLLVGPMAASISHGDATALGVFDDAVYTNRVLEFRPGDQMLLISDGVIPESAHPMNHMHSLYSRLVSEVFRDARNTKADAAQIMQWISLYSPEFLASDDISILSIRRGDRRVQAFAHDTRLAQILA